MPSASPIPFVEGMGGGGQIATFTDSDGNTNPGLYSASIDWGNGQTTTSNMIGYSNGQFQVYANMTYADEGSYPINVTITDQDNTIINATATAQVSDAPLSSNGMVPPIQATAGQPFNGQLATFSDENTSASPSDFTAFINWGDGQISTGSISGSNGFYQVNSSHTYAAAGSFPVQVTIYDLGGSQVVVNNSAQVAAGNGNGVVSGEVWQEAIPNGTLDTGESGLSGITVNLINAQTAQTVMTTTTDAYGNYAFDVDPSLGSQFQIQVILPSGENATTEYASQSGIYSSIDGNGLSAAFALAPGGAVNLNAGLAPGIDVYTWNPQRGSTSASLSQNWKLNGLQQQAGQFVPGNHNSDKVVFDGSQPNGNSDIVWDGTNPWVFDSMSLGVPGGKPYTKTQTIAAGLTVELKGSNTGTSLINNVSSSGLNLNFKDNASKFTLDGDATITNMNLSGNQQGQFQITGGTTKLGRAATPASVDNIGVTFVVYKGATLDDHSTNPLTFTNSDLTFKLYGRMLMTYSAAPGNPIINQTNGLTGDYVDVNGGTLTYEAKPDVTDTIGVPILVEAGGTFAVAPLFAQNPGGTLIVSGNLSQTNNASVYLVGANSSVQLSGGTTLQCNDDYSQASGTLETMDGTTCTLKDGDQSQRTASILGGSVIISQPGGYGKLQVNCAALTMAGTYQPKIAGDGTNQDQLLVSGQVNFQAASNLKIQVVGDLQQNPNGWVILTEQPSLQNGFATTNEAALLLTEKFDDPKQGSYKIKNQ